MVIEVENEELNTPYSFVFSTYFLALKDAWRGRVADYDLVTQLYDLVSYPLNLKNRNGDAISCSKDQASKIRNRAAEAHGQIKKHCKDQKINDSIVTLFRKSILPKTQKGKHEQLVHRLASLIQNSQCSKQIISELIALSTLDDPSEFLARAFQESLIWSNKLPDEQKTVAAGSRRRDGIESAEIPDEIDLKEMPYVCALMNVYGESEGVENFEPIDLEAHETHKAHFQRQRRSYYSAEFVRRCMRDSYADEGENQFETLEDEVYEGVVDVFEDDYETGRRRLTAVLKQAALIPVDKCWASRDTNWIGNSEKKGVCHILVNEERIKGWLNEDQNR